MHKLREPLICLFPSVLGDMASISPSKSRKYHKFIVTKEDMLSPSLWFNLFLKCYLLRLGLG